MRLNFEWPKQDNSQTVFTSVANISANRRRFRSCFSQTSLFCVVNSPVLSKLIGANPEPAVCYIWSASPLRSNNFHILRFLLHSDCNLLRDLRFPILETKSVKFN